MQHLENKARIAGSFFITAGIMVVLLMILMLDLNLSLLVNILLTNLVMGGNILFITLGLIFLTILIGHLRNQKKIFKGSIKRFGAIEISIVIFLLIYIVGFILSGHATQVCEGDGCLIVLFYLFYIIPPFGISAILVTTFLLLFFNKTGLKKDNTVIFLNFITPLYFLGEVARMITILLSAPYPFEPFNTMIREEIISYAVIYVIIPVLTIIFGIGLIRLANKFSKIER